MYKLWMFDFDNTIARLEPEVDWAGGRLILEPYLRSIGAPDELFARIPRGNLPLYDAYRTLMLAKSDQSQFNENLRHASEIIEMLELAGVDRAQPLEGAIEIFAALKASGAAIAIVTSNSSKTVKRWFDTTGARFDRCDRRTRHFARTQAGARHGDSRTRIVLSRSIRRRIRRRQRRRPPCRAKLRRAILRNRADRQSSRSIARGRRHRNLRLSSRARDSSEPAHRLTKRASRRPCFLP